MLRFTKCITILRRGIFAAFVQLGLSIESLNAFLGSLSIPRQSLVFQYTTLFCVERKLQIMSLNQHDLGGDVYPLHVILNFFVAETISDHNLMDIVDICLNIEY